MRPLCLWFMLVPTTVVVLAVSRAGDPVIEDAHSRAFTVLNDVPLPPGPPLAIEDAHSRAFTVLNDLPLPTGPPLAIEDAHSRAFTVFNDLPLPPGPPLAIEDAHSRAFTVFNDLPLPPGPPLAIEDAHSRAFTVLNDLPLPPGPPLAIEDAHSRAFTVFNEVIDCNGNDILDQCDIGCGPKGGSCDVEGCGLSSDCNGNGVPDECELPESCPEGICTDSCDADCNANCVIDACDVDPADPDGDGEVSDDCNGDLVPDECEVPPIGPPEGDCNDNGIPDECDISSCTTDNKDFPACDDCNLNGIPDGCDITSGFSQDVDPADGVPDECVRVIVGDVSWTDDIWDLDAQYPDNEEGNPDAVPDLHVTISGEGTVVFLDETVATDTLRIRNGATLEVTQTEVGDFTLEDPGGLLVEGSLLVANDRLIDVTAGAATIGPGGVYQAEDPNDLLLDATLEAGSIMIRGGSLEEGGGEVILSGSMVLTSNGDLLLEEFEDDGKGGCKGSGTPPDFNSTDSARVTVSGSLSTSKCARVSVSSSEALLLGGDFDNFSINADTTTGFDWTEGALEMNGTIQTIEAAGEDRGPWPIGLENNFVIGTLTLAVNTIVQVVDEFDNQQDGLIACDEALYVDTLIVNAGAALLTDGCRVYYNELTNDGAVPGLGVDVLQIRDPIPPDLNGDGKVDAFDLALLLGSWGPCPAPCAPEGDPGTCPASCTPEDHMEICRADISGDCEVEAFDLANLLGSWGPVP